MLPQLRKLEQLFPDTLLVVGVHTGKYRAERRTSHIRQAVLRYDLEHPVVNDRQLRIWRSYAINAWPTLVFLTPTGRYVAAQPGEAPAESLAPIVGALVEHFDAQGQIDPRRPEWLLSERAGQPERLLRYPSKLLADGAGHLWIADTGHQRVLELQLGGAARLARVTRSFGGSSPGWEDGPAEQARFHAPRGLALAGGTLYVADTENHAIRAIELRTGQVRSVAGTGTQGYERHATGPARSIALSSPWDVLALDGRIVIAMAGTHQLWAYDPRAEQVGPIAGTGFENILDGPAAQALLAQPSGLASDGQTIFFADAEASAIRALHPASEVRTIVGTGLFDFGDRDGIGDEVELQHPLGLAYAGGMLYVADSYNNRLKLIDPQTRAARGWAGSGQAGHQDGRTTDVQFYEPEGLSADGLGHLFIADTNNHCIRVADLATAEVWTLQIETADGR